MFMAIDPKFFCPGYAERMGEFADALRTLPRAPTAPGPLKAPGDIELEQERLSAAQGVALHINVAAAIARLGKRLEVSLPPPLALIDESRGQTESKDIPSSWHTEANRAAEKK